MKSMKKLVLAGLVLLASVMVLVGCKNDSVPETPKYTVKFETNHGTTPKELVVESGTQLTAEQLQIEAEVEDNIFLYWYDKDAPTQKVEAGYSVTKNVTLVAKWEDIPNHTVKFSKGSNTDGVSDLPAELRVESGTVLTAEQLKSLADTVNCCFTGWYDGETEVEAGTYKVTKDVTLTAGWVEKFITFSADSEQTLTVNVNGNYTLDESLQYSVGGGEWKKLQAETPIPFGGTAGYLRMRGKSAGGMADSLGGYACIMFDDANVKVSCSGDIRTLVDYESPTTIDTSEARFSFLFENCSVLTKAPALPAENLADYCYEGMFYGCTSLTSAPALSAETLVPYCYAYMFSGCRSLTSAPELAATTLADYCYQGMFLGCERLDSVTMLATDILAEGCLDVWLNNVSETGIFNKAAAMDEDTLRTYIPADWTVQDYVPQQ